MESFYYHLSQFFAHSEDLASFNRNGMQTDSVYVTSCDLTTESTIHCSLLCDYIDSNLNVFELS